MRQAHSIVAGLDDADMIWLLSIGKLRPLRGGEPLVEVQRPIDDLFFVIRGRLAVILADHTRVAVIGEGGVVGEMSFLEKRPPSVAVRADGAAEVLAIPRALILARFDREPVFAARFYRALAMFLSDRLRDTTAAVGARHDEEEAAIEARRHGERFRTLVTRFLGRAD